MVCIFARQLSFKPYLLAVVSSNLYHFFIHMASADELIYLDYNATTPLDPEVKEAITGCLELYGNPSSSHALGRAAKEKYESSRAAIADLVNADPDEIVIMSCGTETINYCLRGAALGSARARHRRRRRR